MSINGFRWLLGFFGWTLIVGSYSVQGGLALGSRAPNSAVASARNVRVWGLVLMNSLDA